MKSSVSLSCNPGAPPAEERIGTNISYNSDSGVATLTATLPSPLATGQSCRIAALEVDPAVGPQQVAYDMFSNEGQSEFVIEFVYTPGRQVIAFASAG